LKPATVTIFWIAGAMFDSVAIATVVGWVLLDGEAKRVAFILMLSIAPTFFIVSLIFYWIASGPARFQSFLRRGQRGTATVVDAHMTGARVNAMPVLKLDLEVNVPGSPPYRAQDRVLAFPGSIERGATFECVVDPDNPQKVVVLRDDQPVLREPPLS
jgi:hypothetical protein